MICGPVLYLSVGFVLLFRRFLVVMWPVVGCLWIVFDFSSDLCCCLWWLNLCALSCDCWFICVVFVVVWFGGGCCLVRLL